MDDGVLDIILKCTYDNASHLLTEKHDNNGDGTNDEVIDSSVSGQARLVRHASGQGGEKGVTSCQF